MKKTHYYVIDLVRIYAAVLVLLYHFATFELPEASGRVFPFLWRFDGVGDVGVEIFFVISGFVISMSAEGARSLAGALRFMHLRAVRILPALWISSLIAFAALAFAGEEIGSLVPPLIRSSVLSPVGPYIDGVVWSLVVEAVFYLMVGITIVFAPRVSLESLAKILCAISTLYLVVWSVAFLLDKELFAALSRFPSKVFLLRYGVFFALGMLLWLRLRGSRSVTENGLLLLAGFMCLVEIFVGRVFLWGTGTAAALLWLTAVGLMVLCITHSDRFEVQLSDLQRKTVRYLGSLSYALYLNHYTFGGSIVQSLATILPPVSPASMSLLFCASIACVLLISCFVTSAERLVKKPLMLLREPQLRSS
ncbi:acyltransferase [Rhizobium sp. P32RR-XVIII]|uniref:acyltransferase family protein n=1 Tax=Rhizobium sp. P32RR-XVIII TaxID=2726738 RepID=UPI00248496C7|nr:acyltransferase [Rhizobium sp. P32RR-XVIII]